MNKAFVISLIVTLSSCHVGKTVSKYEFNNAQIVFVQTNNLKKSETRATFYATVSYPHRVETIYSFLNNGIYKVAYKPNKITYQLVYDGTESVKLTSVDSIILKRADAIMDSLGRTELKRFNGATGFVPVQ
jgi:hypothetical protein